MGFGFGIWDLQITNPESRITPVVDSHTRIGAVHLTVSELDRSIGFYRAPLGFALHRQEQGVAFLGAGADDLLVLYESPAAPRVRGTTGLYHFAILVPSRGALAVSLRRLVETRTTLQGAADHGVSEAIYLADPDGNGIEIYRDRPVAEWPTKNGALAMTTDPRFYVDLLGFDIRQRYGPSALFVAAGGYHHHIGLNTWAGIGAPAPPAGAIGLRYFVVTLPDAAARDGLGIRLEAAGIQLDRDAEGSLLVRDPSSNALLLKSST